MKNLTSQKRGDPHFIINEWINTIEILVPLIRQARYNFSPNRVSIADYDEYDLFEANSTLYQVDRLVNKIREYILILQAYNQQFSTSFEVLKNIEFTNANHAGLECYLTMMRLIEIFPALSNEKRLSNDFISQAQALELKCSALRQAVWRLNQFVMNFELKNQLDKISDLSMASQFSNKLKVKAKDISNEQNQQFILTLIGIFDILNYSLESVRSEVVKRTMERLYFHIDLLISECLGENIQKEQFFSNLYSVFSQLESLRFCTNRDNHWSRELFDKAKSTKRTLRKACMAHPLGREFLVK